MEGFYLINGYLKFFFSHTLTRKFMCAIVLMHFCSLKRCSGLIFTITDVNRLISICHSVFDIFLHRLNSEKQQPIMINRAAAGSLEQFLGGPHSALC